MLAILAAILFAVGYILDATATHTNAWLSPGALYLAGVGDWTWTRRPPQ